MNTFPVSMPRALRHSTYAARCLAQRGFTLVELMVVVMIIGILATIAYPSYADYVIRARLVEARDGLVSLQADLERHYQDNRTYLTQGAFITPCARPQSSLPVGSFAITCVNVTANGYVLQASGRDVVAGFTLTVNETGLRQTVEAPPGWPTCPNAWVMRRGSGCA
jgi:type IV pilus assembly protein PilE